MLCLRCFNCIRTDSELSQEVADPFKSANVSTGISGIPSLMSFYRWELRAIPEVCSLKNVTSPGAFLLCIYHKMLSKTLILDKTWFCAKCAFDLFPAPNEMEHSKTSAGALSILRCVTTDKCGPRSLLCGYRNLAYTRLVGLVGLGISPSQGQQKHTTTEIMKKKNNWGTLVPGLMLNNVKH
jgi:hypothetical protein